MEKHSPTNIEDTVSTHFPEPGKGQCVHRRGLPIQTPPPFLAFIFYSTPLPLPRGWKVLTGKSRPTHVHTPTIKVCPWMIEWTANALRFGKCKLHPNRSLPTKNSRVGQTAPSVSTAPLYKRDHDTTTSQDIIHNPGHIIRPHLMLDVNIIIACHWLWDVLFF